MSDVIGRVAVPGLVSSGLTFPLISDQNYGFTQERPVIIHRFGSLDAKQEQRYAAGIGPRKFAFRRDHLSVANRTTLAAFWEALQGSWQSFIYNVPNADQSTTPTTVTWEYAPLSFRYLTNACQVGFNFVEVPAAGTPAFVNATCLRFPSSALSAALLSEVQQIVPLIHIRPREGAVPDIWLSDRRMTLSDGSGGAVQATMGWGASSQLYLPRLLGIGEPGSDVLISQDIKGASDNVRFTFGNADRVMTALANDTDLKYASVDLCLFHVNSGILIQVWKGVIQSFVSDGTANFPVTCSDGFFQIMNQYPERQVSRQCWKMYDDGVNCKWATLGASAAAVIAAGGDPGSCDYYLESPNGCQVHGMAPSFGGCQSDPQGVVIKDNSTGFLGFARNKVTATSIVSETAYGLALPEVWANSGGNPFFAFIATALMMAYRDESGYADSLGIVSAGPIGGFSPSAVVENADGYEYIVAPMVDGYLWQGFKVNGSMQVTTDTPGMGLRQVAGSDPVDPATDYFSLGAGTPQVWEANNYAAGVAFCEIRIVKSTALQPSTPDQHQMTVPIDYGLWGWVWDQYGNRSAVPGLINPFWIAVNMLLRALGLYGSPATGVGPSSATQLAAFALASLIVGDGSGAAEIAGAHVTPIFSMPVGTSVASVTVTYAGSHYTAGSAAAYASGGNGCTLTVNLVPDEPPDGYYTVGSITINNPGFGFGAVVDIVITGSSTGDDAQATATLNPLPTTETQFQFQGAITSQKPFRDWMAEVLNCCLGFYAWEFGRLKLGCRVNASSVDAYTLASILYQSLRLTPIPSSFEHLVLSFADVAYQYQANTGEYCDKTHAAYYGRAGSPLTSQMHSVGCSTLSQALRLAATRTREELGGVTPMEWRNARAALWQTTLLGLGNEVGQVVSMTHPDIPGARGVCNVAGATLTWVSGDAWTYAGTAGGDVSLINKVILVGVVQVVITAMAADGSTLTTSPAAPAGAGQSFHVITMDFRITKWSLKKDWSVQIEGQTVTKSMYDLDVGPQPMDVAPAPLPSNLALVPAATGPLPWAPGGGLSLQIQTPVNRDNSIAASIQVLGAPTTNTLSPTAQPPTIYATTAPTGGAIPGGVTYYLSVTALDALGLTSAASFPVEVAVPAGTNTNAIHLGLVWEPGSVSGNVFLGLSEYSMTSAMVIASASVASVVITALPAAIEPGPPDATVQQYSIEAAQVDLAGCYMGTVATITPSITLVGLDGTTPAWAANQWQNYEIDVLTSVLGRSPGTGAVGVISGNGSNTLTLAASPIMSSLGVGAIVVIRMLPSTHTATMLGDANLAMGLNQYMGKLLFIFRGTGAGQSSLVASNTVTTFSLATPLAVAPDATSRFVILEPNWLPPVMTVPLSYSGGFLPAVIGSVSVPNTAGQAWLLQIFTVNADGEESPAEYSPTAQISLLGAGTAQRKPIHIGNLN